MFQDMSSSMLMEKARKLDCDILIFVKTKGPVDTKMTKFETSVKILDARSGKFRKDFFVFVFVFVLEPRQIAKRILSSSIITPTEDHEK